MEIGADPLFEMGSSMLMASPLPLSLVIFPVKLRVVGFAAWRLICTTWPPPVPVVLTSPLAEMAMAPVALCCTSIASPSLADDVTDARVILMAEAPFSLSTSIAGSKRPLPCVEVLLLVTAPVATIDTSPRPLWLIRIPRCLPVTDPTVICSEAFSLLFASPKNSMPSPPALKCPVAVMSVFPAPLFLTFMASPPPLVPVTVATLMVISPPLLSSLTAYTASPLLPVLLISPVAVIDKFPAPEFVTRMTPVWPTISWPVAD